MGFHRFAAQGGVGRLDLGFEAIGSRVAGIRHRRIAIDGILTGLWVTLARFHCRGAFALDSAAYAAGGLPSSRDVMLWGGPWLLALFIEVVDGARQPSLSV